MTDKSTDILYDHYKETYALSKEAQGRRNKNFVILCVLEALLFLTLISPDQAFAVLISGINAELDTTLQLTNTVMQTLLWLLIAYVTVRYVQDTLYVERQYGYLVKLEKTIRDAGIKPFDREGDHYMHEYPIVLDFIDLFYKMLMPILFMAINIVRIVRERVSLEQVTIAFICDLIICLAISIITWFYFFKIHSKITAFCKEKIPFIGKLDGALRKILKKFKYMAKKKVCCSFDYEHDRNYYYLLKEWDANDNIDFTMNDCTPNEIESEDVGAVKQVLSTKIGQSKYMVAIIGEHSNDEHSDSDDIGYRNWQAYEIAKNHEKGNGLVVVMIDKDYSVPLEAYGIGAKWVYSFDEVSIIAKLNELAK